MIFKRMVLLCCTAVPVSISTDAQPKCVAGDAGGEEGRRRAVRHQDPQEGRDHPGR